MVAICALVCCSIANASVFNQESVSVFKTLLTSVTSSVSGGSERGPVKVFCAPQKEINVLTLMVKI